MRANLPLIAIVQQPRRIRALAVGIGPDVRLRGRTCGSSRRLRQRDQSPCAELLGSVAYNRDSY
jgi:hypothetical protein